ncbi:hypothetical protein [Methylocapsa sp. S129]|uniref:hypothetical protein n=1 Tax=Methylocapsa sp. S129 TaxID=1641869 RepID=UPI00131EA0DB|nr:hypothetical protein [Methylocapsa sp. S129]
MTQARGRVKAFAERRLGGPAAAASHFAFDLLEQSDVAFSDIFPSEFRRVDEPTDREA